MNYEEIERPVAARDLAGRWYNKKYPGDYKRYGSDYHDYPNEDRETIFYDFAVMGYDLMFSFNGQKYYVLYIGWWVALSDENFSKVIQRFENANLLIENLEIEGHKLIDIIDDLENVQSN